MAKTPEGVFQDKVIKYLKSHPRCWYTKIFGGGFQRAGIPDILACVNGVFVAIELKREGGKATPLQVYNIQKIKECGGIGYILHPSQFEEFKEIINKI